MSFRTDPPACPIIDGTYPQISIGVEHRRVLTSLVTELSGVLTASVSFGHNLVASQSIWTDGLIDSAGFASNISQSNPSQIIEVGPTSVAYPAPSGTSAGSFNDGIGFIHVSPETDNFVAFLYDQRTPGSAPLNITPITTGSGLITGSDGYTWTLDLGFQTLTGSIYDAQAEENGHLRVQFIPNVGAEQNVEIRLNTAEHLSQLFPNSTVFVDTNNGVSTTTFPAGSLYLPVSTPSALNTIVASRNPTIIDFFGSWGGSTLTTAAIGTALVGRYIRGNPAGGDGNAMYAAANNNIEVTDAVFDGVALSTTNQPSHFLGPFNMLNTRSIVRLDIGVTGTRFGELSADNCTLTSINLSNPLSGTNANRCWTIDAKNCVFEAGSQIDYAFANGSTSNFVECTGDIEFLRAPASGLYSSTFTININGHKGSSNIVFDQSNNSAARFAVAGAVNSLLNNAGMIQLSYNKLAHRSDIVVAELLASTGSTATQVTTNAPNVTGFYDGMLLQVSSSSGQAIRAIDSYDSVSGQFNLQSALPFTPASSDQVFVISNERLFASSTFARPGDKMNLTLEAMASSSVTFWNALTSSFNTPGSAGAIFINTNLFASGTAAALSGTATTSDTNALLSMLTVVSQSQSGTAQSSEISEVQATLWGISQNLSGTATSTELSEISNAVSGTAQDVWNYSSSLANSPLTMGKSVNNISSSINFIERIEGGRWRILNDQMIFYASDNSTEVARFNLFDSAGNPTSTAPADRQRI